MSFKFEVPGCMQNKVGCFVDLSDSAIYDESGGIPTTEDLEAVIDYNLTENCPKWMMQYPEHAGLIRIDSEYATTKALCERFLTKAEEMKMRLDVLYKECCSFK